MKIIKISNITNTKVHGLINLYYMSKLIFVTSENCELCNKAFKKIKFINFFSSIKKVDVTDGYEEYLLRIPVLLKNDEVVDEGVFNFWKIIKKLVF